MLELKQVDVKLELTVHHFSSETHQDFSGRLFFNILIYKSFF